MDKDATVTLPSRLAFKGDNGKYLRAVLHGDLHCLEFTSTDPNDGYSAHEVIRKQGGYQIKSEFYGKFWKRNSDNWILADSSDETGNDMNTLFWAEKVEDALITLHNAGANGMPCGRLTANEKTDCLIASGDHPLFQVIDLRIHK